MGFEAGDVLTLATLAATGLLVAAAGLVLVRLALGPTVADRALALDVLGFVVIGLVAVRVVQTGHEALFDAALALALMAFLATVALARYVEYGGAGAAADQGPDPAPPPPATHGRMSGRGRHG